MTRASDSIRDSTPSPRRAAAELFLISGLILFLELACIRWFPAHVLFLTFFTNTVLLACFLGMSLGCLAAGRERRYLNSTPLLLALTLVTALAIELVRDRMEAVLDVGNQASPQLVFFGTEYNVRTNVDHFVIPIELLGGVFFLLIALVMVGPGQELGRAMTRLPNRVRAYSVNIFGSIVGIVLFSLVAWLQLSPGWWFAVVVLGLAYFLLPRSITKTDAPRLALLGAIVLLASATKLFSSMDGHHEFWSPYYRTDFYPQHDFIRVNLIGHQRMIPRDATFPAYALPYLLNRDSGGRKVDDALIIGAGSGNDVSRALQWGVEHIDAVEIDPQIRALGQAHHPDRPYADTQRVTLHQADGRNFLRTTDKKYDLVIYALVDSLVLHSSYSNIRLESYLFTKEAIDDVKRCLKPGGLFVMYNYYRQGWIVARLQKTLTATFGSPPPLVFTFPYLDTVDPETGWEGFTFFVAGDATALENLRRAFHLSAPSAERQAGSEKISYWLDGRLSPGPSSPNGFTQQPAAGDKDDWYQFSPATVSEPTDLKIATDDWPFLYLRGAMIPALSLRGAAIMGASALVLLLCFAPRTRSEERCRARDHWIFDGRMFFLGAGFMLIETKAVVNMALLFGSTWMVNAVVFLAVLVMILLANLFVLTVKPRLLWPYYVGLLAILALNIAIPLDSFLGWSTELRTIGSCLLVFAPIGFAAVIFAQSFDRTRFADQALGFNIAGAMLGGLAEYCSMLLGFRYLLLVAMAFYLLSAIWRSAARYRTAQPGEASASP